MLLNHCFLNVKFFFKFNSINYGLGVIGDWNVTSVNFDNNILEMRMIDNRLYWSLQYISGIWNLQEY